MNEEQHEEDARAVAEHRIPITLIGEPYRDVGSASDYARKKIRDGFGLLLTDLKSGDFGADVLVMWENSRASRQPREWIAVADACGERGILIFITTQRRNPMFDPRDPRDCADLIDEAVKAMRASAETSERVIRALNANLNHGDGAKPQGQIPFGYQREYAMTKVNGRTDMRPVGQTPKPETARLVIELFKRIKPPRAGRPDVAACQVGRHKPHDCPQLGGASPCLRGTLGAMDDNPPLLLIVDAANVVGSVPDGWWRDRRGAAERLRDALAAEGLPGHAGPLETVLVVEGAARGVESVPGVRVEAAPGSGDDHMVELVARAGGGGCLVVTADRELRRRVTELGAKVAGPRSIRRR